MLSPCAKRGYLTHPLSVPRRTQCCLVSTAQQLTSVYTPFLFLALGGLFFLFLKSVFYCLFFYSFFSVLVCRLLGFRVQDYYSSLLSIPQIFSKKKFVLLLKIPIFPIWYAHARGSFASDWFIIICEKVKIFFFCKNQKKPVSMNVTKWKFIQTVVL